MIQSPSVSSREQQTLFYQMSAGKIEKAKVVLIGITETRSDHLRAVAIFLNSIVHKKTLFLIEYEEKGIEIIDHTKNPILWKLKELGFDSNNKPITVKGWDDLVSGAKIRQMEEDGIPYDLNLIIGKRNESMIASIKADYSRFNKIIVLAGSAHLCTSPATPEDELAFFKTKISRYHEHLMQQLKKYQPMIIVPVDMDQYENPLGDLALWDYTPPSKNRCCTRFFMVMAATCIVFSAIIAKSYASH